jgi:hypothetical protein
MSEPLAYHITWRTYGTQLPGEDGWGKHKMVGIREASAPLEEHARKMTTQSAVMLDETQRSIVENTIREHCRIRGWTLHAVNVRTTHVHVVVTAEIFPDRG